MQYWAIIIYFKGKSYTKKWYVLIPIFVIVIFYIAGAFAFVSLIDEYGDAFNLVYNIEGEVSESKVKWVGELSGNVHVNKDVLDCIVEVKYYQ